MIYHSIYVNLLITMARVDSIDCRLKIATNKMLYRNNPYQGTKNALVYPTNALLKARSSILIRFRASVTIDTSPSSEPARRYSSFGDSRMQVTPPCSCRSITCTTHRLCRVYTRISPSFPPVSRYSPPPAVTRQLNAVGTTIVASRAPLRLKRLRDRSVQLCTMTSPWQENAS